MKLPKKIQITLEFETSTTKTSFRPVKEKYHYTPQIFAKTYSLGPKDVELQKRVEESVRMDRLWLKHEHEVEQIKKFNNSPYTSTYSYASNASKKRYHKSGKSHRASHMTEAEVWRRDVSRNRALAKEHHKEMARHEAMRVKDYNKYKYNPHMRENRYGAYRGLVEGTRENYAIAKRMGFSTLHPRVSDLTDRKR